jgi:transposase
VRALQVRSLDDSSPEPSRHLRCRPAASRAPVRDLQPQGEQRTGPLREAMGAELRYLPPSSPDPHPIEQVFAKLKAMLRKAAERTVDALWDRIAQILDAFTPHECANCLANAGCGSHEVEIALEVRLAQASPASASAPDVA